MVLTDVTTMLTAAIGNVGDGLIAVVPVVLGFTVVLAIGRYAFKKIGFGAKL